MTLHEMDGKMNNDSEIDEFIANIKDKFPFIITREMWNISSVKTEDGYEQTKFGFNTRKD